MKYKFHLPIDHKAKTKPSRAALAARRGARRNARYLYPYPRHVDSIVILKAQGTEIGIG